MGAKVHWSFGGGTPCAFYQQALVRREMTTDAKAVTCKRCLDWLRSPVGQIAKQHEHNRRVSQSDGSKQAEGQ